MGGRYKIELRVLMILITVIICFGCAENTSYKESFFTDFNSSMMQATETGLSENSFIKASEHYLNAPPLVEYIIDYKDNSSVNYSKHIKKICDYTKIPFRSTSIHDWNSPNFIIASSTRVINIHNPSKLNDQAVQKLLNFVAKGGTLFFASVIEDNRFKYFYGFNLNASYEYDETSAGFKFITPLLPNMKGLSINDSQMHYGLKSKNFMKEVTPLLTAVNNTNYGVILEHEIGSGRVVFLNSELMIDKFTRGLIFATFLPGLEGVPYPIANISTIYLDDFPSPVYDIMKEPIATEMGITMANFVENVWWPDMQKLAQEFDINYTTTITFDYNSKVTPPFIFSEWNRKKKGHPKTVLSDFFTRDVLKKNFELGFHGFNHVSLTASSWKNTDYITTALHTVKKKWSVEGYGNLPTSYIPPSNIIDSTGISKLKQEMPSIKYICSSYFGNTSEGSNREFDIEPFNAMLFDYPRLTSEYELSSEKLFVKESTYLFTGIWSHFVHPDDVYQIKDISNQKTSGDYDYRNVHGYGWYTSKDGSIGLFPRFKKLLEQHKKTYPLSEFVNAKYGASRIHKWRIADYYHQNNTDYYRVKKKGGSYQKKHNWFIYVSNDNIVQLENYLKSTQIKYHKTPVYKGCLVNVTTKLPVLRIPRVININDESVTNQAYEEYHQYFNEMLASNEDMSIKVVDVDEKLLLLKNLKQLKKQMFSQKTIQPSVWNNYARMNDWLNKEQDVWAKLDSFYNEHKSIKTAKYSNELAKITWYPTEQVQEYWLLEQINLEPNNISLLKQYVKHYNTEVNSNRIATFLKKINVLEYSPEAKKNYVKHILWKNSPDANTELDAIKPSEIYIDIADDVAWHYYEKGNLEKAYSWSSYTNEIDFVIKLDWLYTLEEFDTLSAIYSRYIKAHTNDNKTKAAMAYIHHSMGDFKLAWIVSDGISESYFGKEALKKMLNKDVIYVSTDLQKELLNEHSKLFRNSVKDSLKEYIRIKESNSVQFSGDIASDRSYNTSFDKISTFTLKDNKNFSHNISFTNSDIYALNTSIIDSSNVNKELYGFQYKINNPITNKLHYWSKARLEKDRGNDIFIQFGVGANLSKKKSFSSISYNVHPVKNAITYNRGIYRNRLGIYHENNLNKAVTLIGYAEGNYYSSDVSTVSLSGKIQYHLIKKPNVKCFPFLESEYSYGTINQPSGYPFWVLENRLYGGGGVGGQFGNKETSKLMFRADAAHFSDDYSDYFTRFNGKLSIRFLKYYVFQTSAEYYIQSEYYSNRFNFGLQYYLK